MAARARRDLDHAGAARAPRERLVVIGLVALGAYQVALGVLMAVAPGTFFELAGPFGERNDHYIRDGATWTLALGAGMLAAVRLPGWRVPVLAVALVHWALHSVSHLIDVGAADPGWVGPADLAGIAAGTLLLAWLLWAAVRERGWTAGS